MSEACAPYRLTVAEAEWLKGLVSIPTADTRGALLARYAAEHGAEAVLGLFAEFVGLARSVQENTREMVNLLGWMSGDTHPDSSEGANLPTLFGALCGVELAARVVQRKTCNGCAFRLGAIANQSPITTDDAAYCVEDRTRFMCHERGLDPETGAPTKLCAGYAQARRECVPSETSDQSGRRET